MSEGSKDEVSEETSPKVKDDVVRKRDFQRAQGVDFQSFMVQTDEEELEPAPSSDTASDQTEDIAVGEVASLFSSGKDDHLAQGAVQTDGTVVLQPEMDSVTDMAVHGEKRLSFGLLVAMVLTWSAIGAIVGTVLPEVPSGLGLLAMGVFGLYLGERWIPNPNMRLLGVTWVIISMKLFYGLALDALSLIHI